MCIRDRFRLYKTNEFAVIPIVPKIYRTFALISTKELSESFVVRAFIDTTLQRIHTHLKDPAEKVPNK